MVKGSAILLSWVVVTPGGKTLVQINGELPEGWTKKYEEALK